MVFRIGATVNVYLDYNAGAPLRPAAAAAMHSAAMTLRFGGNASSPHRNGRAVRAIVDGARESIAVLAGADTGEIVFTSGATEAVNTVLASEWDVVIYSGLEHNCVRDAIRGCAKEIPVASNGIVDLDALQDQLRATSGRRLVAVMAASNETGAVQPVAGAAGLAKKAGAAFLCDATQGVGRIPFSFRDLGIEFAACSAHKLGGPPGIGALMVRSDARVSPLLLGGGQESRRRAGTENVIGIAGFGAAAAEALTDSWNEVRQRRDWLESAILRAIPNVQIFGKEAMRLANTTCLSVPGWEAESLVIALDLDGYAVGAGSACSSGKATPGQGLIAMGYGESTARSAIRISSGVPTRREELEGLFQALLGIVHRSLRKAA